MLRYAQISQNKVSDLRLTSTLGNGPNMTFWHSAKARGLAEIRETVWHFGHELAARPKSRTIYWFCI